MQQHQCIFLRDRVLDYQSPEKMHVGAGQKIESPKLKNQHLCLLEVWNRVSQKYGDQESFTHQYTTYTIHYMQVTTHLFVC